jgi:hypothetical protein
MKQNGTGIEMLKIKNNGLLNETVVRFPVKMSLRECIDLIEKQNPLPRKSGEKGISTLYVSRYNQVLSILKREKKRRDRDI